MIERNENTGTKKYIHMAAAFSQLLAQPTTVQYGVAPFACTHTAQKRASKNGAWRLSSPALRRLLALAHNKIRKRVIGNSLHRWKAQMNSASWYQAGKH